ncbi:2'-5' RNA ligase family protein [Novosphingobium bradum]|uniref:2'-5' RNA ligase family protein n=1 Tax=Novosphingobium bradum TaxID=1737444 RepID=A0ABV7IU01_9SPHN
MSGPGERAGPFIVTAELPAPVLAWADGLRRAHFPPERNHLAAHVTLFHAFAPSLREELRPLLAGMAADHAPVPARVSGLMNLGRGTAIALHSPAMLALRAAIADHFHGALTAQDQHPPRLHITVQNKVSPAEARALQQALAGLVPDREFAFAGLGLHRYLGPEWETVGRWPFRGARGVDQPARRG